MDQTEILIKFKEFIDDYYKESFSEAIRLGKKFIVIDFNKLIRFDIELSNKLIEDPQETLKQFEAALEDNEKGSNILTRIKNIPKCELIPIRHIRSRHLDKLLVIEGNVKNRSTVRPQVTEAKFECPACGNIITIIQTDKTFKEPSGCGCGRKGRFTQLSTQKIDLQYVAVEEPFEQLDEDSVPQRIGVLLKDDLTDPEHQSNYIPGKPIMITGILKEVPITTGGQKSVKIDWILEANYCKSLEENLTKTKFNEKDIKDFKELAKDPAFYKKLVSSMAPHIYGHKKVKEAMLLFLAKGVSKKAADGKCTREYFNVLLMGDPGAAKSQLGNEVNLLSWRSRKVVGKGASGPGLTASAEKDEVLNMRVLSAGAIPLCNEGHVVVDEVDKMEKDVQAHLHESMEDGTITINKSQVQGQLKARTAVFMIGNPKYGRFDPYLSVIEQIDLPKPLINRFDLIFPVKDIPQADHDKRLAETILEKHMDIDEATKRAIPLKLLKNYLCYVALNIKPKMTKEAADVMKAYFLRLRNQNSNGKGNIGITGRQLDGLVRMAEASAKLHMRAKVKKEDAKKAIELMTYSLEAFGIDRDTGKVDIDILTTGMSASQRSNISRLKDIIIDLEAEQGPKIPIDDVLIKAEQAGIKETDIDKLLKKLSGAGDIIFTDKRHIQRII